MRHTRHHRFCHLAHHGIRHQERTVRGFEALARLAPNRDSADLMMALAEAARTSIESLRRQHHQHCHMHHRANHIRRHAR